MSKERKDAALIKEECVSTYISRFLVLQNCQSYLSSIDGKNILLCNRNDDSSLFLKNLGYENIFGKKLEFRFERIFLNLFQEHGYIIFKHAISEPIIDLARMKILEKKESRISNLFELDQELFVSILKIPILKVILDEIFVRDKEYHLTTYSSNTLRFCEEGEIHFHVDYPYHDLSYDLKNSKCDSLLGVQVIIPLNDFTIENGATLFIGKVKEVDYFYCTKRITYYLSCKSRSQSRY